MELAVNITKCFIKKTIMCTTSHVCQMKIITGSLKMHMKLNISLFLASFFPAGIASLEDCLLNAFHICQQ